MAVRPRSGRALAAAVAVLLTAAGCGSVPAVGTAGVGPAPSAAVESDATASASPAPGAGTGAAPTAGARNQAPKTQAPKTRAPKAVAPKAEAPAAALLSRGDEGTKVRELQHRLRQLDWFAGDITGRYAATTVRAVRGFQDKRGIRVTGAVDKATWTSLTSRSRMPTDDELHNRLTAGPALLEQGASGDRVRNLQARLKQLAWFSGSVTGTYGALTTAAVKGFQGKRGLPVTGDVDQRTLDRLAAMTRTPTSDQLHNRTPKPSAAGLDSRCLTGRALCVSKSTNTLTWVIDGKPQMRMDVRFGSAELPTREGAFAVGWKSRHHVSTIYHTSMPYAMFFSGGQAVHYSPDFAARGYNGASHGCVNVRNLAGIQSLFAQARVGDKVIVYR
jgi:peptidoglycan hydrolase-like protein with peptidoglycan-binding domain